MITDLGSMTLAAAVPAAADATAAIDVTAGIAAPDVSGQLTALASFKPVASVSLAGQLSIALSSAANIQSKLTAAAGAVSKIQAAIAAGASTTADQLALTGAAATGLRTQLTAAANAAATLNLTASAGLPGMQLSALASATANLGVQLALAIDGAGAVEAAASAASAAAAADAQIALLGSLVADLRARMNAVVSGMRNLNASPGAQLGVLMSAIADLETQATLAANAITNIQAAIVGGLTPPSLDLQVSTAAAIATALQGKLTTIQAQVDIATALGALLATGSVRLLVYSGQQDNFGSELATALGADTTNCNALVLTTQNGTSWTAMQGVFLTA